MDFDDISAPLSGRLAETLRRIATASRSADWQGWREHGLNPAQRALLLALGRAPGGLRLVDLANELNVSKPTVTASVDALVAKGLVQRVEHPGDARSRLVQLDRNGRTAVARMARDEDPIAAAFDTLSEPDRAALGAITLKVVRQLQQSGHLPAASMCLTCAHFEPWRTPGSDTPHHCHFIDAPMGNRHLRLHCAEHHTADPEHQAEVAVQFERGGAVR